MANVTSKTPFAYVAKKDEEILAFNGSTVNVPPAGGSRTNIIVTLNVNFARNIKMRQNNGNKNHECSS